MKHFVWVVLVLVVLCSIAGCARTKRIANDVDWIVFDGEPNVKN